MTEKRKPRGGDRVRGYGNREWRVIETDKNDVCLESIYNRKWVRMDRFYEVENPYNRDKIVRDWAVKP